MPPPKEYRILRKGRVQTVSKAQYYRIKAKDSASMRTPELQALLNSQMQADNDSIASGSASGNHADDDDDDDDGGPADGDDDVNMLSDGSENSDVSMDTTTTQAGDQNEMSDNENDLYYVDYHVPDACAAAPTVTPPPIPQAMAGDNSSTPSPEPEPFAAHNDEFTPPREDPDRPQAPQFQGHRRTIADVDLDELERLAKVGSHADILQSISFIQVLRRSTLDNPLSPLDPDALDHLRNTPQHQLQLEDPHLRAE